MSLNALLSENKARILASPRVAVLSGQKALIDVGVKYLFQTDIYGYGGYGLPLEPYSPTSRTQTSTTSPSTTEQSRPRGLYQPGSYYSRSGFNTIDTGIMLDITPWVGNAGEITMTIAPTIRDADEVTSEQARIADRSIDTIIRVKDGGMIIIGGLLQEKELTKEDKVPILGRIPLMGRLFSKSHKVENESELIIVIKPRIINSAIEEMEEDATMPKSR
jgi:type II secretory pathway component GspD/PulD (secretin)